MRADSQSDNKKHRSDRTTTNAEIHPAPPAHRNVRNSRDRFLLKGISLLASTRNADCELQVLIHSAVSKHICLSAALPFLAQLRDTLTAMFRNTTLLAGTRAT